MSFAHHDQSLEVDQKMPRKIVIVGGGLSGLSAAECLVRLYGEKVQVTVLEARRSAGGRVGSFYDPRVDVTLDYCQHVTMGCCVNFIDLLDRCGLRKYWVISSSLAFSHASTGITVTKPWRWLPAPFHQLPLLWRIPFLSMAERYMVQRGMFRLMRHVKIADEDISAATWLKVHGQSNQVIENFWDVFSFSALGESTREISVDALKHLFVVGFAGNHRSADIWVPTKPLSEIFGVQLVNHLQRAGVRMIRGCSVRSVHRDENSYRINCNAGELHTCDHVISAVPWHQIQRIICEIPELAYLANVKSLPSSEITGVHLWFDRSLGDFDQLITVGTVAQWIFRPTWTAHESDSNDCVSSSKRGYYYQVVISGSQKCKSMDHTTLINQLKHEIRQVSPQARDATLLSYRVVTDPRATIICNHQNERLRPEAGTPLPSLHLAGDWTATGWPSTMEGAVISGQKAVANLAAQENWTTPEPISTAPLGWLSRWIIR